MHTEVCRLHPFQRLGYFPVHLMQLLLSEKQITLYQVINLHETHRTNICYLDAASSMSKGTKACPPLGHRGPPKAPGHEVTLCFILGHLAYSLKTHSS